VPAANDDTVVHPAGANRRTGPGCHVTFTLIQRVTHVTPDGVAWDQDRSCGQGVAAISQAAGDRRGGLPDPVEDESVWAVTPAGGNDISWSLTGLPQMVGTRLREYGR
jgi:hypothetical protein